MGELRGGSRVLKQQPPMSAAGLTGIGRAFRAARCRGSAAGDHILRGDSAGAGTPPERLPKWQSPIVPERCGCETSQRAVLDRAVGAAYLAGMDRAELVSQLQSLTMRIDELTDRAKRLVDENRSLRQQQEQLSGERAALLSKNEQARVRVEAMIARLKSLEQHT